MVKCCPNFSQAGQCHTHWVLGTGFHHNHKLYWITSSYFFSSSYLHHAYMPQWIGPALVQIWLVAYSTWSHYLNQCWVIANWNLGNKLQWNFDQVQSFSFTKNVSENVNYEMAAILSSNRWVNEEIAPMTFLQCPLIFLFVIWKKIIWTTYSISP